MKIISILVFLGFCAMGSMAELGGFRLLQYDDDSRATTDIDNTIFNFSGPTFPNGTPLAYWREDVQKWADGQVVGFKDGYYFVRWDDKPARMESYDSHFSGDRLQLNKLKRAASRVNDDPPSDSDSEDFVQFWENGTRVRSKNYDGSISNGKIVNFNGNEYKVEWSNGKTAYFDDYDILEVVQLATKRQRYILVISIVDTIVTIGLLIVLWICVSRWRSRRKAQALGISAPDPELALDEEEDNHEEEIVDEEEMEKELPEIA